MLWEESCVESIAKGDHVKVHDRQEDVDESDPASARERREWNREKRLSTG